MPRRNQALRLLPSRFLAPLGQPRNSNSTAIREISLTRCPINGSLRSPMSEIMLPIYEPYRAARAIGRTPCIEFWLGAQLLLRGSRDGGRCVAECVCESPGRKRPVRREVCLQDLVVRTDSECGSRREKTAALACDGTASLRAFEICFDRSRMCVVTEGIVPTCPSSIASTVSASVRGTTPRVLSRFHDRAGVQSDACESRLSAQTLSTRQGTTTETVGGRSV